MEMMEAISDLSEKEFMELAFIIYCMGYPDYAIDALQRAENGKRIKQKIKTRIEDWLEILNGRCEVD